MLFCVTGASGSGKSASLAGLRRRHPEIDWHDFDDLPFTPQCTAERQVGTEYWLQVAANNQRDGRDTGIAGSCIPGEVLACPSAPEVSGVRFLLLDCNDIVRIDRILRRDLNPAVASQEMLNWAAWQRMHAVDPQWRPDVIRSGGAADMNWQRWNTWTRGDARWQVEILDTTRLAVSELVDRISGWLADHRNYVLPKPNFSEACSLTQAATA